MARKESLSMSRSMFRFAILVVALSTAVLSAGEIPVALPLEVKPTDVRLHYHGRVDWRGQDGPGGVRKRCGGNNSRAGRYLKTAVARNPPVPVPAGAKRTGRDDYFTALPASLRARELQTGAA
jgi:hypothetical protein